MPQNVVLFSHLKVTCETSANRILYLFDGSIDDGFLSKDLKIQSAPLVEFDLSHVLQINSIGTREWILMLRQFSVTSDIHYLNCSVAMVDAFNSVRQLYGNVTIKSIMAPYFCPKCQLEVTMNLTIADCLSDLKKRIAPTIAHDRCGTNLEFDALEESYFGIF